MKKSQRDSYNFKIQHSNLETIAGDNYQYFPIHYNTKSRTEHGTVQGIWSMSLPPNVCFWYEKSLGSYSKDLLFQKDNILAWLYNIGYLDFRSILGKGTYFKTPRYSRKDSVQHKTVSKQILWSGSNYNYYTLTFFNKLLRNCFVSDRSTRGGFKDGQKSAIQRDPFLILWCKECLFETWNIRWTFEVRFKILDVIRHDIETFFVKTMHQ